MEDELLLNVVGADSTPTGPKQKKPKLNKKERKALKKAEALKRKRPPVEKEEDDDGETQEERGLKKLNQQTAPTQNTPNTKKEEQVEGPPTKKAKKHHNKAPKTTNNNTDANQTQKRTTTPVTLKPTKVKVEEPPEEKVEVNMFSGESFEEFKLNERLISAIHKLGITKPTLIQQKAIPPLLKGADALVKAETGSGKTLTYLVPIMEDLLQLNINREQGTFAVIIAPTRELCQQIYDVAQKMCKSFVWIVPGICIGGEKKKSEKSRLRKGITILVATPGRLKDHLQTTQSFKTDRLRWLILDEADRLLDMGFEKDVGDIIKMLRSRIKYRDKQLQSALVSATLPEGINRLAGLALRNPKHIEVELTANSNESKPSSASKNDDKKENTETFHIPPQLKQHFTIVECKQRLVALSAFLRWKSSQSENMKIIVFFSNCDSVDFHHVLLGQAKAYFTEEVAENQEEQKKQVVPLFSLPILKLHGNLTQVERSKVYNEFNKIKRGVLVCTDVAARGIDFPNIDWIIQYDPPEDPTEYIHRVGRTARLGREGNALLFLLPSEQMYVQLLKDHGLQLRDLPVDKILDTMDPSRKPGVPLPIQIHYERMVLDDDETLAPLARKAFLSFMRAYATHSKNTKHIFHVRNLHFGHVAKSFALREAPSQVIALKNKKIRDEKRKAKLPGYKPTPGATVKPKKPVFKQVNVNDEFGI